MTQTLNRHRPLSGVRPPGPPATEVTLPPLDAAMIAITPHVDGRHVAIGCALHAVGDTQSTIRAIDTKAQILCGIVGVLLVKLDALPATGPWAHGFVLLAILTIICALSVIVPRIPPPQTASRSGQRYFVPPQANAAEWAAASSQLDWLEELYTVLARLSVIRQRKTRQLRLTLALFLLALLALLAGSLATLYA
ncbi:Pycsar system effector family protein [Crenobacter intestini]|uniref:Pycsar effector protein domain-containing protein n=1 Tax=Crenobacter intestini TaxID=2563443 RepID=A0A4T0UUA7_9NEIS|nr:Pycsar system effector family protein [Crenobacter intestini]TIC82321.1 hypothetical protein E5K04_09180 [Crenobacter intestini]